MVHCPRSPLETHLAPSLPEPAGTCNMSPVISAQQDRLLTNIAPNCSYEYERNGMQFQCGSTCKQKTQLPEKVESQCQRQRDTVPLCPVGEIDFSAWNNGPSFLTSVSKRSNTRCPTPQLVDAMPTKKETYCDLRSCAAPSAYEAALAEYGKKLLDITQKQQCTQKQRTREALIRRKAVNEKYTLLSRPPATNGCVARTSEVHRACASNDRGASRRRGRGGSSIAAPRKATQKVEMAPKTHLAHQSLKEFCVKTSMPTAMEKRGEENMSHKNRERKSFSESIVFKADATRNKAGGQGGCSSSSSWSDRDVATQTRAEHFLGGAPPGATSPTYCHFHCHPRCCCCCRSSSGRVVRPLGQGVSSLDSLRLTLPPRPTPPRPLGRVLSSCSLGDRDSSPFHPPFSFLNPRNGGNLLYRSFAAEKTNCKLSRCGSVGFVPQHRSQSHNTRTAREECGNQGKKMLTPFFRLLREPRPLHRHLETLPYRDDNAEGMRGISFHASAFDGHSGTDSLPYNSNKLWCEQQVEVKKKQLLFENTLLKCSLGVDLRQHLLQTVWHRWRKRLKEQVTMKHLRLDDGVATDVECGESCSVDVEVWLRGASTPVARQ